MDNDIQGARLELPLRRPGHLVAAVFAGREAVQSAVAQLNKSGFSEDRLFVIHGKPGAEALRRRGHATGFLRRTWGRFAQFARGEDDFVRRHIEAAEAGNFILGVELSGLGSREQEVYAILRTHDARDIVRIGRGLSEELMNVRPDRPQASR